MAVNAVLLWKANAKPNNKIYLHKKALTFSYDPQHCLFWKNRVKINVHLTQKDSLGMYTKFRCINPCRAYLL